MATTAGPNALARRLHAAYGDRVAVVNAGIGGNQVAGPAEYSAQSPSPADRPRGSGSSAMC